MKTAAPEIIRRRFSFRRKPAASRQRWRVSILLIPIALLFVALWGPRAPWAGRISGTAVYGYQVIQTFPHDPGAFTQGLVYQDGVLYESTGLYGKSSVRKVHLETGRVLAVADLSPQYFGEGLTIWKDRLIQLTWQSRIGFLYDAATFRLIRKFPYPLEGWGLTQDEQSLIASDGSAQLYFLDPELLKETRRILVTDQGRPVPGLNELEYIRGEIYANVFLTDRIARISPSTGRVLGWIDLSGLLAATDRLPATDVLNGIAYDHQQDRLLVTGKNWPKLFQVRLIRKD
jgi:glutamine cyclotransferase